MSVDGFIVHAAPGYEGSRAFMALYVRGVDGAMYLVRDSRFTPYFYVAAARADQVPLRGGVRLVPVDRTTLFGVPVVRVEAARGEALRQVRRELEQVGVACFEADLRPAARYLIDRQLRGGVRIIGQSRGRTYDDPILEPLEVTAPLSSLSLDIETTADASTVLSIALHGAGRDEVLLLTDQDVTLPATRVFRDEASLLAAFVTAVRERDPDILTGWNVIDFDLTVLLARAAAVRVPLSLGRDGGIPRIAETRSFWNASRATVTGRVVLDGMQLLRSSFVAMDEYGLDFVAQRVLGEGKTVHGPSRLDELQRLYRDDLAQFVAYNLNDAQLVTRIVTKLGLTALAVQRSLLTGMPLDRVAASIASFDALYLPELAKRGVVAGSVSGDPSEEAGALGGLVLEPLPGLYRDVFVFDFKSLYPSLMRTFQIDPLGHAQAGDDAIVAPNGARFSRQAAILPAILDTLVAQREAAKQRRDEIASHAIKILMNSLYGVLGASSCRFHDNAIANAITAFGRAVLEWTKQRIEHHGHVVLYGDTDSVFVQPKHEGDPAAVGRSLLATLNSELSAYVRDTWSVESKLELEFDTHYARLLLPKMRSSEGGARKRYVGLVEGQGVVFTGMEVVRRDWTELAKLVQRELYERLFSDRPVDAYVRDIVKQVHAGALDHTLVYKKALRKPLETYTANTPPHVAAARKMTTPVGRLVSYVVTVAGPQPVGEVTHALDRAHYIDKQLRPIAEPVLELLHLDFDEVADNRRQLRLF